MNCQQTAPRQTCVARHQPSPLPSSATESATGQMTPLVGRPHLGPLLTRRVSDACGASAEAAPRREPPPRAPTPGARPSGRGLWEAFPSV